MRSLCVVAIFLLNASFGLGLDKPESAKKLTDQVLSKASIGKLEDGLALLKPYVTIPETEFGVLVEQVKLRVAATIGGFGKILGFELISQKEVGKSLLRIVQIQKYEKHVLRWEFIFYNPGNGWVLNAFVTDDKVQTLFDD